VNQNRQNIITQFIKWCESNQKVLLISGFVLIALWFLRLNYINWDTGVISNGLHGIKHWLDTDRYTDGAESILTGSPLHGRQIQFIGYILIIAFTKLLSLPIGSVVVIQILVALLAAYALYDAARIISGSRLAGFVASALFLTNPFIVSWHMYILTESLYTSFVIFSFWSIIKLFNHKKLKNYIISILILLTTIFIRPNGWILLPIFICIYIISFTVSKNIKIFSGLGIIVVFVLAMSGLSLFNKSIQITTPVKNLQEGITVWGHPELNLVMPNEPNIDQTKWTGGLKYVVKHPWSTVKLGAIRAGYTLIHFRPFHSTKYKLRVLFWIIPAYLLTIITLMFSIKKPEIVVALAIIIGHLFVVAVSYAEHDSRFDIYILPIFYLLAGIGLAIGIRHIKNRLLTSM